jgi:hypothetical protein
MKILQFIANLDRRYGGPSKACLGIVWAVADFGVGYQVSICITNKGSGCAAGATVPAGL